MRNFMQPLFIAAFAIVIATNLISFASARSLCSSQPTAERQASCRKTFGIPEGGCPDMTVIATAASKPWTFRYFLKSTTGKSDLDCESATLTLPRGGLVEVWIKAESGLHPWKIPSLGIDALGMAGSLSPVKIDTSKSGTFESLADPKKGPAPAIQILEPKEFVEWRRKVLGKKCSL
jgi:heme/copper-type cytochrome/quinol oxidase subunit 2